MVIAFTFQKMGSSTGPYDGSLMFEQQTAFLTSQFITLGDIDICSLLLYDQLDGIF